MVEVEEYLERKRHPVRVDPVAVPDTKSRSTFLIAPADATTDERRRAILDGLPDTVETCTVSEGDSEVRIYRDGADPRRKIEAALDAADLDGWGDLKAREKRTRIGEAVGWSARTVHRKLKDCPGVDGVTGWLDERVAAHLDDTEPATVTRITVDPEGMKTVELVARKAARDLRLAIDDVEDTLADCVEGGDGLMQFLQSTTRASEADAEAETTTDDYRCPYGETWKQRCARAMDRSLRVLANARHVQRWRVELERQWRRDCRIWELANADTPDFLDYLRDHDAPTWLVVGLHLAIADDPIKGAAAYPDAPWPEAVPAIPVAIPSMRTTHRGTPRPG